MTDLLPYGPETTFCKLRFQRSSDLDDKQRSRQFDCARDTDARRGGSDIGPAARLYLYPRAEEHAVWSEAAGPHNRRSVPYRAAAGRARGRLRARATSRAAGTCLGPTS
jgi:hypothetical protein